MVNMNGLIYEKGLGQCLAQTESVSYYNSDNMMRMTITPYCQG